MKSLPATLLVTALLASCGGGGGGSDQVQAQNDEGSPVAPLNPAPLPLTPVSPITPPVDAVPQLGELSDLIGGVGVAYNFYGTETVFSVGLEFSTDDFSLGDSGSGLLLANAESYVRLSPTAQTMRGRDMLFACSFPEGLDIFLCILDLGGASQSFFTFGRLVDGSAQGLFEFCNGATTEVCASGIENSPDGISLIQVSSPLAKPTIDYKAASEKTDLLPYLQYLKQGSLDGSTAMNSSNGHVDALIAGVKSIEESLANK